MKINLHLLLFIAVQLCLASCSKEDSQTALYGSPTTIKRGESPLTTVCRIQEAFRQLPKPVMSSMSYQPAWTSRRFGAAEVKHRGYHKVQLTPEALSFVTEHSRLELVASLIPMLRDPDIGGEAAALLAGIPAGNKSVQGGKTAKMANALYESGYRSPSSPGRWFDEARQYYSNANTLYGLINTTQSIHRQLPANLAGSLEASLIEVLEALSHAPLRTLQEQPYMPQPHDPLLITQWVQSQPTPKPADAALVLIDSPDPQLVALTLFPLLPEPQYSVLRQDEVLMMYILGEEQKYWPAVLQLSSGQQNIRALKVEFQFKVQDTIAGICRI